MKILTWIGPIAGGAAVLGVVTGLLFPLQGGAQSSNAAVCGDKKAYELRRLDSEVVEDFCATYAGKVVLVVNTASRCAYTGQYEGLEKLYADYRERGLVVVGFPSNDFGNQEPGSEKSIKSFCRLTYGVRFPMYAKSRVRGEGADPLFQALYQASGERPRWNFHKYLINRNGELVGSYRSSVAPGNKKFINAIETIM
jgi:glutathione peroxidase